MSENFNDMNGNINEKFDNTVSGVERVTKKKGKKVAVVSGITALVIVGGGVASYNLSDFVKNQVNLRVMKPDKYYAWVTEENSKEIARNAKESYQKMLNQTENGCNSSLCLEYAISDSAKDLALSEILGYDDYRSEADEEEKALIDVVDNINSISLGMNADNTSDGFMSGNVFAALNGEHIIDGDFAIDAENFNYFLRIPELNQQWLLLSLSEYMADNMSVDFDCEELMKNPSDYLSPEELEDIIIRYTGIWNRAVEDVEIEKKEAVDICDITVDYTVVSAELTENDCYNLCIDFLKEIRDDDIIKNLCVNKFEVCTEDEYVSTFDEIIDDMKDDEIDDTGETVTVDTYIDSNGSIRGMRVYVDDDFDVFCAVGKDGNSLRGEMYTSESNEKVMGIELYADDNNGKYSGNIDITDYESYDYETDETVAETVSVEFTNYEVVDEEKGYFNAGITFNIPDTEPIYVDFSTDGNSQNISYNINFDGTDYGTISLTMASNEGASVEIPDRNDAFFIEYSDYMDVDFESYISQESLTAYVADVLRKIGFSEELATEGAESFAGSMYGVDTDWDYYDDDDDYDFDFEFSTDDDFDFDYDNEGWSEWQSLEELETENESANTWNPQEEGMFQTGEKDEIILTGETEE